MQNIRSENIRNKIAFYESNQTEIINSKVNSKIFNKVSSKLTIYLLDIRFNIWDTINFNLQDAKYKK